MPKRRGNKEGSLYKRANGTWQALVSLDGKRLSFSSKSRQTAQDWIKQTITQIDAGLTYRGANTNLENYLENWLIGIKNSIRPGTWYQYDISCRNHIIPSLGMIKLKDLDPGHLQEFYDRKLKEGIGVRTVKVIHVILHKSLKHAVKLGMIGRNPADVVNSPVYQPLEMKIYNETQVNQMLLAASQDRNGMLFTLAVTTGCRQSELLALKWSDLDWQKHTLHIQRQLTRINRQAGYFVPLKTKAANRTISLGVRTLAKLREHNELQHAERQKSKHWQENDLIFPSTIGTPQDQYNLYHKFVALIQSAGLPIIRFHDLRHTAASLMINHGVPIIVVSKRLGHSRVSITLDTYSHLLPEVQTGAAELIDELVMPVEIQLQPLQHNCNELSNL